MIYVLERDCKVVDWSTYQAWCTTFYDPQLSTHTVRSSGVVNPEFGVVDIRQFMGTITTRTATATGVHVDGPLPGDEYTPYQVSCSAYTEDPVVRPMLFVGESPASPTSGAGGDSITNCRLISVGGEASTEGAYLQEETIVALPENTADRALCFFVAMYAGSGAGSNLRGFVHLSVRRLIGVHPPILDTRKL